MAKILVVDDSAFDRQRVGKLLLQRPGTTGADAAFALSVTYAVDGQEALSAIEREKPDLILTDMQMPNLDGFSLVRQVRLKYPLLPVILMTAAGSEEVAIEALRHGAANYVPKKNLAHDLLDTVETILESSLVKRDHERLLECLRLTKSEFVLENDPSLIAPLVGHLKDSLYRMSGSDETGLVRVTVAIREAVLNAMHHGNLELNSALREEDERAYELLTDERRNLAPYKDRRVFVSAADSPGESTYVIRDEGPGFDPSALPDPTAPENLERPSGRGLLLIRSFMDEVRHNSSGNEITLIWRRKE